MVKAEVLAAMPEKNVTNAASKIAKGAVRCTPIPARQVSVEEIARLVTRRYEKALRKLEKD